MKTFISILTFILCMGYATAAGAGVVIDTGGSDGLDLEQKLKQKLSATDTNRTHFGNLSARECPLYASVRAGLEEYYGKNDFSDPNRQSGWYRVHNFLKWLKRNEPFLQQEKITMKSGFSTYQVPVCRALRKASYKETFTAEQMQGILSVWLGARYTADMFVGTRRVQFPYMKLSYDSAGRAIIDSKGKTQDVRIEIHSDSFPLVKGINLGLHEGTHLSSWMAGGQGYLGEWGTYLATVHFALPVRANGKDPIYHGARSFTHNVSLQDVSCDDLLNEYAAFVLGSRLYPQMRQQNFFNFEQAMGSYKDGTFLSLLRNLSALKKNKLYIYNKNVSLVGSEKRVLDALKRNFADCAEAQQLNSLEEKTVLTCDNRHIELIPNAIGDWALIAGEPAALWDLIRSIAPQQLRREVEAELKQMAAQLEPALNEIPLEDGITWQIDGIKDLKKFKKSSSYGRLCNAVRSYASNHPSGVPPVPKGYM